MCDERFDREGQGSRCGDDRGDGRGDGGINSQVFVPRLPASLCCALKSMTNEVSRGSSLKHLGTVSERSRNGLGTVSERSRNCPSPCSSMLPQCGSSSIAFARLKKESSLGFLLLVVRQLKHRIRTPVTNEHTHTPPPTTRTAPASCPLARRAPVHSTTCERRPLHTSSRPLARQAPSRPREARPSC